MRKSQGSRHQPLVGDRPWLVPHTAGAPAAAYRQPQVTVVAVDYAQVTVRLPLQPGQHVAAEVTTSKANLSYTRPQPPTEQRPSRPQRRPVLELGPGEEEALLW